MGGFDNRISIASQVIPAHIVSDEKEKIGLGPGPAVLARKNQSEADKKNPSVCCKKACHDCITGRKDPARALSGWEMARSFYRRFSEVGMNH